MMSERRTSRDQQDSYRDNQTQNCSLRLHLSLSQGSFNL
jgi:hypothetical protein